MLRSVKLMSPYQQNLKFKQPTGIVKLVERLEKRVAKLRVHLYVSSYQRISPSCKLRAKYKEQNSIRKSRRPIQTSTSWCRIVFSCVGETIASFRLCIVPGFFRYYLVRIRGEFKSSLWVSRSQKGANYTNLALWRVLICFVFECNTSWGWFMLYRHGRVRLDMIITSGRS